MPYGGKPLSSGERGVVESAGLGQRRERRRPGASLRAGPWAFSQRAIGKGNGSASMAEKGSRKSWPALSGLAPGTPLPEPSISVVPSKSRRIIPSPTRFCSWWVPARRRSPSMVSGRKSPKASRIPSRWISPVLCTMALTAVALSVTSTGNNSPAPDWRDRAESCRWRAHDTPHRRAVAGFLHGSGRLEQRWLQRLIVGSSQGLGPLRHGAVGRGGLGVANRPAGAPAAQGFYGLGTSQTRHTLCLRLGAVRSLFERGKSRRRCIGARPERIRQTRVLHDVRCYKARAAGRECPWRDAGQWPLFRAALQHTTAMRTFGYPKLLLQLEMEYGGWKSRARGAATKPGS